MRQIILDTETTGLKPEEGHRIIEVGCLEMIDRRLTGKSFHYYLNPERDIDAGAVSVHGITNEFLKDKPFFADITNDFIKFIQDAELIIHNAPFDIGFINAEFAKVSVSLGVVTDYCTVVDTLVLARKRHVGQRNSLDALCKRYNVDLSKREWHGALLDASLLAQVYLAMTGGQGSFFDEVDTTASTSNHHELNDATLTLEAHELIVQKADEAELKAHEQYLQTMKQKQGCLWLTTELDEIAK